MFFQITCFILLESLQLSYLFLQTHLWGVDFLQGPCSTPIAWYVLPLGWWCQLWFEHLVVTSFSLDGDQLWAVWSHLCAACNTSQILLAFSWSFGLMLARHLEIWSSSWQLRAFSQWSCYAWQIYCIWGTTKRFDWWRSAGRSSIVDTWELIS